MRVLIGSPVRQSEEVFKMYLGSLDNLEIPRGVTVDRLFILHNSPELKKHINNGTVGEYSTWDRYDRDDNTHHWRAENLHHVTVMKNGIIDYALKNDYDYFFLVDSDLILHPKTLKQLISADKSIIAEVFWTKWTPDDIEMPNAWDLDQTTYYQGSIDLWRKPGIYPVGMSGACILIRREVMEASVNYDPIYNVSFWGEDRAFCIRAAVHGFQVWLDTHYPATHLYRQSDVDKYKLSRGST